MDQQFSLSWNNFHGNLSKGFASLLGKAEFVDVTIAVEGHLLQAHKVILSICSPYFKKMFLLNPCQHPIVVLRDVTYKAMKDLLQFMYQGEVSVKREDLNSFIGTAELLQIKGLTNKQGDEYSENEHEIIENASKKDTETNHIHKISKSHETSQNEINLKRHCEIIQRLHKFTSLKRKSEEFLQKNYFSTDIFINADKRQKLKEQYSKTSDNAVSSNSFESYHNIYNDNPIDTAINYTNKSDHNSLTHGKVTPNSRPEDSDGPDTNIDIKPECEDDIIVTEPDACITPKNFDSRLKDGDFPLTQENCTSYNSLFMDIKSLANGKSDLSRSDFEDTSGNILVSDHHLVTIPQKEDGKKKYPQRSCRLCWKMGKRRDTRFMCKACELPFCKYPCFDMHYQNYVKASQLHRGGGNEFLTT